MTTSDEPALPAGADPFALTTGAEGYIPRPACERALEELQAAHRRGAPCIALVGPNGIGKTQLLRVLASRLENEAEVLVLPYAAVELDDLCHWVLGLLGEDQGPYSDPGGALLEAAHARAETGRGLLLAIDDASGLPIETARAIGDLARQSEGALRVLAVPIDDSRAGRVLAALGAEVALVRFNAPMTEEETHAYVAERLRASGATAVVRERFAEPVVSWLHRESGGLPRELHALAVQFLRGRPEADRDRFARREQWLEVEETGRAAEEEAPLVEPPGEALAAAPPSETAAFEWRAERVVAPSAPRVPGPPPTRPSPPTTQRGGLRRHLPLLLGSMLLGFGLIFALRSGPSDPRPPERAAEAPAAASISEPEVRVPPGTTAPEPADLPEEPLEAALEVAETPAAEPLVEMRSEQGGDVTEAVGPGPVLEPDPAAEAAPPPAAAVLGDESPLQLESPTAEMPERKPPSAEAPGADPATAEPSPAAPSREPQETEPAESVAAVEAQAELPPPVPFASSADGPLVDVRIDALPPARLWINGRDHGTTPVAGVTLASGHHRFELRFPDGTRIQREKLVDATHRELRFSLRE